MANQDWLYRESAPLIVASRAAGLTGAAKQQADGLAIITARHKQLVKMPEDAAMNAYAKLDRQTQGALKQLFGESAYNKPNGNFIDKTVGAFGGVLSNVSSGLESYTDRIGQVWRTAATHTSDETWLESWSKNEDGKRIFDQDREDAIRGMYAPATLKIAKRMSMGDTPGEILSDLTSAEEFAAMRKMLDGDKTSVQALRDFDQAKISFGRSVAHLFGLEPDAGAEDQGAEGTAFKLISGAADFAYDVILDPTTWITGGISAYRKAALGIMSLSAAEAGAPVGLAKIAAGLDKSLGTQMGKKFTWEGAFADPKVTALWDDLGAQIKIAATSKDAHTRAVARVNAQELPTKFSARDIEHLIEHKVFSAEDGLRFMRDQEGFMKIMQGRSGSMQQLLPSYKRPTVLRKKISSGVGELTGYNKQTKALDEAMFDDTPALLVGKGQSAAEHAEAKAVLNWGRRAGRMFERAIVDSSVYTSDAIMRAKSEGTIYTLARLVFDKRQAQIVAKQFVGSETEADARLIVKGLIETIADKSGATATEFGRAKMKKLTKNAADASYSMEAYISEGTAKAAGLKAGPHNPGKIGDRPVATALNQLKHQMVIPSVPEIVKIAAHDNTKVAWALGLRSVNHAVTDTWSALNLLPRLGIRSVMDEALFSALTMPVEVAMHAVRGYQVGITKRLLENTDLAAVQATKNPFKKYVGERGLTNVGWGARHILRPLLTTGVTEDVLREAAANPKAMAHLLETQLTKSLLGKALFAGPKGKKYSGYVKDIVDRGEYGQVRALGEGFAIASTNDTAAMGTGIGDALGIVHKSLRADMRRNGIKIGGNPTKISRGDAAYTSNAALQLINVVDRNGEIGKRAVMYMEDPQAAVNSIVSYLKSPAGSKVYKSMERSSIEATDIQRDAFDMYVHVRQQFTNDLDEVNADLLAKVRPGGPGVKDGISAKDLTFEDISELSDGMRREIFGYGKDVKRYPNFANMIQDMLDNGFAVMDRQVGTLSREPSVVAYALHFRGKMEAQERFMMKRLIATGMTKELAEKTAKDKFTTLSMDLAVNRVIGFVDNPNVRSNLAFGARNIARYYRANEDFYRRAIRVFREQGAGALLRLRMANEGLGHAGFIHEDADGDQYFTFPVDEIMYSAYATIMTGLGMEIMRPMPLALTGKIKMMTPSLDPESNLPTFAGPLMSLSWAALKNVGLIPEEYRSSITTGLFGQYAEGQSWYSQLVPSTMKRASAVFKSATGLDDEQIASATMKAMAYYAANGMAPGSDSTLAEREEFKRSVRATARSIVFMRNTLGMVSFVSPQVSEIQDLPKELLQAGVQPFKTEFQNMVQAEYDKGNLDAWNTAMVKWTKVNPGRLVYTVSQSEADTVATIRKTRQSVEWIQKNRGLAEKYKEAAVFLMPQANNFDMDAYSFLKREGFIKTKDVDKYFEEIANVVTENRYYDIKKRYEDKMMNDPGGMNSSGIRAQMDEELRRILKENPFLKRVFEQRDGTTQLKRDVVTNMANALDSGMIPTSDTANRMRKMIRVFNVADNQADGILAETDAASAAKKAIKSGAAEELAKIAGSNPNAVLFYETILKRLLD